MRDIKFRAWTDNLKDKGEMYYQYLDNYLNPIFTPAGYGLLNPTLKIMQYTGVKDKSGKEIYEGDIINVYDWRDGDVMTSSAVKIYFQNGCFGFISQIINCFYPFHNCDRPGTSFKIIGNIYENPELLEN